MEKDIILSGVHIGEHSFNHKDLIPELFERCVKPGYNFVTIRTRRELVEPKYFIEWAKYLAEHKIYFVFLYTIQHAPEGRASQFDKETVDQIKKIAGEYFVGDMIGETGSSFACKFKGYYESNEDRTEIKTDFENVKLAADDYIDSVSEYIKTDKELGMPNVVSVEATALNKYNTMAGVDLPMLELMCGNPEILVSSLRGVARAYDSKLWGTYVAHEWYGGMRHDDILKRKRLELGYKYAYLAGSQAFCLESGDELVTAYGARFEPGSDVCDDYRNILDYMAKLIKTDCRPKGGPKVKVAFVSGQYDAWGGWGGSSVWNQFDREDWGYTDSEHSWKLVEEIGQKRSWTDIANYGDSDLSANPAYGMYDIIPIEAPAEVLSRYDYLIFIGWNTMTDEIMDKLICYTKNGGKLLMSAAHINYQTKRGGEVIMPPAEKLEKLFGANFANEIICTNDGVKFTFDAENKELMYPGSKSETCDPIYSNGYVRYGKFVPTTSKVTAYVSSTFGKNDGGLPAVLENRVGSGVATLVTSINYPGNPALYPMYRAIVREMVTASARDCDIKVIASDRVKYAVYEGDKMYLLNTDYDLPQSVKIMYQGNEKTVSLKSLELKAVEL